MEGVVGLVIEVASVVVFDGYVLKVELTFLLDESLVDFFL